MAECSETVMLAYHCQSITQLSFEGSLNVLGVFVTIVILIALYPSCNLPVTCTEDNSDQQLTSKTCLKTLLPHALYDRTRNSQAHGTDVPGALACGLASAD